MGRSRASTSPTSTRHRRRSDGVRRSDHRLLRDDDIALAAAEIAPDSAAVMIVYENRWAAPFISAVRRNGGELIASERIDVQDLIDALDAAEMAA